MIMVGLGWRAGGSVPAVGRVLERRTAAGRRLMGRAAPRLGGAAVGVRKLGPVGRFLG